MKFTDYQASQQIRRLPLPDGAVHANMLRLGRQSRGLSLTTLARALGVTSHELQWMEQGKLLFPLERLDALCEALDYPDNFFTDPSFAWQAANLRASGAYTFVCNTHALTEQALDAAIDPKAEVRMLRQRVRALEAQLDQRYGRE